MLEKCAEIDDELYSACVDGLACNRKATEADNQENQNDFDGYRVLEIPEGDCIVVRVASQMGGALETGAQIWTAGAALFSLCSCGMLDESLRGHVLELGAGTGVVGLALARRSAPVTRVTLTDGQPGVVENLKHNVAATSSICALSVPVEVLRLEWTSPDLERFHQDIDVIVGSDLVYDISVLPALACLFRQLLQPIGTATVAVLAYPFRTETTEQAMFSSFEDAGLVCEFWQLPDTIDVMPLAFDRQQLHDGGVRILRLKAADSHSGSRCVLRPRCL